MRDENWNLQNFAQREKSEKGGILIGGCFPTSLSTCYVPHPDGPTSPLTAHLTILSKKSRSSISVFFTFTFWRKQNRKRNTQHCKCKKCLHLETRFLEQLESWTKEVSVAHLEELGPNHLPTGNCFNLSLESKTVYNGPANNLTKIQEKICTA